MNRLALITRAVRGSFGALLLLLASPTSAKVAPISLAELVEGSDLVALAKVTAVENGRARATLLEIWKGTSTETLEFVASPTWTCDISDAKMGETAVLFLARPSSGLYEIGHSGRGRVPVREIDGRQYATIWVGDVQLPATTPTVEGPQPEYRFIRSVPLDELKRVVVAAERDKPSRSTPLPGGH